MFSGPAGDIILHVSNREPKRYQHEQSPILWTNPASEKPSAGEVGPSQDRVHAALFQGGFRDQRVLHILLPRQSVAHIIILLLLLYFSLVIIRLLFLSCLNFQK